MRYVVIGNSAAGVRAVETLRSLDNKGEIIMIAEEDLPAYSRSLLPEFLAGSKDQDGLHIRPRDFYSQNRIKTLFGRRARTVNTEDKKVILEDGTIVAFDQLLIATGASSAKPPIPGIEKGNIFGLRQLSDAKGILEACKEARRAVVIGGGFVGLEAAYALYERGLEVTVVEMMSRILPRQFDKEAADILKRDMQAEGIRFILDQGVKEIASPGLWKRLFGKSGKGVILTGGEQLKAEVVVVATGTQPNIDLVEDTEIGTNRGILVDEYLETNVSSIYAAGDVAETMDLESGQVKITAIWPNASAQGRIAALIMVIFIISEI